MAERRIRFPAGKVSFIKSMLNDHEGKGPFELQAQVIGFAAAYGAKYGERLPFSKSGEPIRFGVFMGEKLDTLINLLAITHTGDPKILARSDEMEDLRATIFEEFANSGLSMLEEKLKGEVKYTPALLLLMKDVQTPGDEVESLVGMFN